MGYAFKGFSGNVGVDFVTSLVVSSSGCHGLYPFTQPVTCSHPILVHISRRYYFALSLFLQPRQYIVVDFWP